MKRTVADRLEHRQDEMPEVMRWRAPPAALPGRAPAPPPTRTDLPPESRGASTTTTAPQPAAARPGPQHCWYPPPPDTTPVPRAYCPSRLPRAAARRPVEDRSPLPRTVSRAIGTSPDADSGPRRALSKRLVAPRHTPGASPACG